MTVSFQIIFAKLLLFVNKVQVYIWRKHNNKVFRLVITQAKNLNIPPLFTLITYFLLIKRIFTLLIQET